MQLIKSSALLAFVILTFSVLLIPCQSYGFNDLDLFYSNDVSGKTEPCG